MINLEILPNKHLNKIFELKYFQAYSFIWTFNCTTEKIRKLKFLFFIYSYQKFPHANQIVVKYIIYN